MGLENKEKLKIVGLIIVGLFGKLFAFSFTPFLNIFVILASCLEFLIAWFVDFLTNEIH